MKIIKDSIMMISKMKQKDQNETPNILTIKNPKYSSDDMLIGNTPCYSELDSLDVWETEIAVFTGV